MEMQKLVKEYLEYCQFQENLSADTRKAYRIDLKQFLAFWQTTDGALSRSNIANYIVNLQQKFKPRTAKRKAASLKAFFSWLEYMEIIEASPFVSLRFKFNEPQVLPRTIPLDIIAEILNAAYQEVRVGSYKAIRDVAVLELMFATGIRVSELCSLKPKSIDLNNGTVLIFGKGAKERVIQIGNPEVLAALKQYEERFRPYIQKCGYLFVNRIGRPYTTQSVRAMVNRYCKQVSPNLHITPHMFRHTFATQLLEADVDIRYIQSLLGHSSISTTQIYTHVTMTKQRDILATKHPRNSMNIDAGIEDTATL